MLMYGDSNSIFSVQGKVALITGGTRGLGREMAVCLLENGCDVILVSRNTQTGDSVKRLAEKIGRRCSLISCDVTDENSVMGMARQSLDEFGRIDILINSAGMQILQFIEEMDLEVWDQTIDVCLKGTFLVMKHIGRIMINQKYGKIINLSSMKSVFGMDVKGYGAYCAAKGGINMLTKQAACEWAKYNITVNAIAPTYIRTDISKDVMDTNGFLDMLINRIPLGRVGEFPDMMGLLLLLSSDASSFITGQTILLDGGIAARQ